MAKGNRKINMVTAMLILVYIVFVSWDRSHVNSLQKEKLDLHISNIKRLDNMYGLILGGSNSLYGLSAQILTRNTHQNWYNASLKSEGGAAEQLEMFVHEISVISKKSSIKVVVYSTIKPFFRGEIAEYSQVSDEALDFKSYLVPSRNALSYIKSLFYRGGVEAPIDIISTSGDLDFGLLSCDEIFSLQVTEVENLNTAADYLVSRAVFLGAMFDGAKVIILVPSYSFLDASSYAYGAELIELAKEILLATHPELIESVEFILQNNAVSANTTCDKKYHTNSYGRKLRTVDLLSILGY